MPKRNFRWMALAIGAVFFLSLQACDRVRESLNSAPTPSNTASIENSVRESEKTGDVAETVVATEAKGDCVNKFYPINTNEAREYRITSSTDNSEMTYVLRQSYDGGDTFIENRDFSTGTKVTNNWRCTGDGLRNAEYNNRMSISPGSAKTATFEMRTLESSGISLPNGEWSVGDKWTANYRISGDLQAGPVAARADGSVMMNNEVVSAEETVEVPAGKFKTARVDSTINIELEMKGGKMPSSKVKMSAWYSPKVGLVKQVAETQFGTETVEYVGTK